jgi:hypothetical protein
LNEGVVGVIWAQWGVEWRKGQGRGAGRKFGESNPGEFFCCDAEAGDECYPRVGEVRGRRD